MDNVINLGASTKPASIPDLLRQMEDSDTTIVIHIKGGRWTVQHLKGNMPIWSLMGMLQCIITHFADTANGKTDS